MSETGTVKQTPAMIAKPIPAPKRKKRLIILASIFVIAGLVTLVLFASQSQPAGPLMQGIIQKVNPDGSLTLKMYGTSTSGKPFWCGEVATYNIENPWSKDWSRYPLEKSTVTFQLRSTWFGLFTAYSARGAGYPMDVDAGSGAWSIDIPCAHQNSLAQGSTA